MAKGPGNKNLCALYLQIFSPGKSEGTEPRGLANPGSAEQLLLNEGHHENVKTLKAISRLKISDRKQCRIDCTVATTTATVAVNASTFTVHRSRFKYRQPTTCTVQTHRLNSRQVEKWTNKDTERHRLGEANGHVESCDVTQQHYSCIYIRTAVWLWWLTYLYRLRLPAFNPFQPALDSD